MTNLTVAFLNSANGPKKGGNFLDFVLAWRLMNEDCFPWSRLAVHSTPTQLMAQIRAIKHIPR